MKFLKDSDRETAARWAYRLFLDREAENEGVIQHVSAQDTRSLRQTFMSSHEFRASNPSGVQEAAPTATVIVPVDAPPNRVDVIISMAVEDQLRAHVQTTWTRLGNEAPHWSVLSSAEFLPESIAQTEGTFFGSGEHDLNWLVGILKRHEIATSKLGTVFEFGCGLGRVTLPLASRFKKVVACDISSSHLAAAISRAKAANVRNINFVLSDARDFGIRESYDLWFSRIVLQHNAPPIIYAVLDRAFAKLKAGGLAVFQVPTYAAGYAFDAANFVKGISKRGDIEMHCLPQHHVFELANRHGLKVLEVREDFSAGPPEYWVSNVFVLQKGG